ncbi:sulfotransferase 1A1-like [Diadema antillarum]|uniref:sulfotransferase 1A1-like n=1 Tax=Diadema antillarum TaxID=105358 RepID=UPI003A85E66C
MTEASNLAYIRGQHVYDGICYANAVLDSSIEALQTFEVRPDDVWVVTYPKAGTHWMLEIVGLILSGGYPEKIDRSSSSTLIEMIDLDQKLPDTKEEEEQNPPDMTPFMEKIKKALSPRVIQTHLRLKYMPQDLLKKAKPLSTDLGQTMSKSSGKSAITMRTFSSCSTKTSCGIRSSTSEW